MIIIRDSFNAAEIARFLDAQAFKALAGFYGFADLPGWERSNAAPFYRVDIASDGTEV